MTAATASRQHLVDLVEGIRPWDKTERAHRQTTLDWLAGGAPAYRTAKPDVPDPHLVSYFVVLDEARRDLLLVAHRKAGLWLPPGGHVEPDEDPWETVVRECREELHVEAAPSRLPGLPGDRPFFVTVTRTRGAGPHTDVSLWYVLGLPRSSIVSYDAAEFAGIRWVRADQVGDEPPDTLDPHLDRFAAKLLASVRPVGDRW
ncbi:NUDIX domain-containing protein [Actinopolymorpha rutila]|uniref:8-oxo-dGTP pyrophosphatase MutT (NUDIX family) n=1 Tax=Actinopolymorpha rutila TaxID=446787 RepID=A0A852Z3U7_9ACTN|nr:NUDIX domain-containing protein [Actinopolymorpha rutila]NYH87481.1 8-oxo-dGTP pyrophosphatase MutT (NUDIX family) [Actinopolymorpha rutila]